MTFPITVSGEFTCGNAHCEACQRKLWPGFPSQSETNLLKVWKKRRKEMRNLVHCKCLEQKTSFARRWQYRKHSITSQRSQSENKTNNRPGNGQLGKLKTRRKICRNCTQLGKLLAFSVFVMLSGIVKGNPIRRVSYVTNLFGKCVPTSQFAHELVFSPHQSRKTFFCSASPLTM